MYCCFPWLLAKRIEFRMDAVNWFLEISKPNLFFSLAVHFEVFFWRYVNFVIDNYVCVFKILKFRRHVLGLKFRP